MFSKIVGSIIVIGLLVFSTAVDAHPRHRNHAQNSHRIQDSAIVVTINWNWVDATLFRKGHWHHPHHGRSYRSYQLGPPPSRPHVSAVWVSGHYEGRGRHRHWVPGHWRRTRVN